MAKPVCSLLHCCSVLTKDCSREAIGRCGIHQGEYLIPLCIIIYIHGKHRPKEFFFHGDVAGIVGTNHGRLYEVTLLLAVVATHHNLLTILFCPVDEGGDLVECFFIDYGIDEVAEIFG